MPSPLTRAQRKPVAIAPGANGGVLSAARIAGRKRPGFAVSAGEAIRLGIALSGKAPYGEDPPRISATCRLALRRRVLHD